MYSNQVFLSFYPTRRFWCFCLSKHLEYLVQETSNWFSKLSNKQNEYKNIHLTINDEVPSKITQACATRWFLIEPAVKKILDQWTELKLNFNLARQTHKCYVAKTLYNLYQNPTNEVYLLYIHSARSFGSFARSCEKIE